MVPWRTIRPALEDYWLIGPFNLRAECFPRQGECLAKWRSPRASELACERCPRLLASRLLLGFRGFLAPTCRNFFLAVPQVPVPHTRTSISSTVSYSVAAVLLLVVLYIVLLVVVLSRVVRLPVRRREHYDTPYQHSSTAVLVLLVHVPGSTIYE